MTYTVKEVYYTVQGEGARVGTPAVFCRFAGCNLWTGREQDRETAICQFCDTDFVGTDGPGGGKFETASALLDRIESFWPGSDKANRFIVFTGGEPLLQLDAAIITAAHERGFEIAIETNGTLECPPGIDWICVSPKAGSTLVQKTGNELKLVYPQAPFDPAEFTKLSFDHFFLQPMDGEDQAANTQATIAYCLEHPKWRVSFQTHKFAGIP